MLGRMEGGSGELVAVQQPPPHPGTVFQDPRWTQSTDSTKPPGANLPSRRFIDKAGAVRA